MAQSKTQGEVGDGSGDWLGGMARFQIALNPLILKQQLS